MTEPDFTPIEATGSDMLFMAPQPEQKLVLKLDRQEWETLAFRLGNIGGTTVVLPLWPDGQLAEFVEKGQLWPTDGLEFVQGEVSRCHANSSRLYLEGRGGIVTGYALSGDGYWRQHTWLVADDGHVIETTNPRAGYFGVKFDEEMAERWARLQLS